jgi:hypothetical protein
VLLLIKQHLMAEKLILKIIITNFIGSGVERVGCDKMSERGIQSLRIDDIRSSSVMGLPAAPS